MKSSVNLATLAVLILCYVHGGVAGKHRGKYVKKKEPEPHKIFVTSTGLCLKQKADCAARVEERFCHFPLSPKRGVRVKTVGISHNTPHAFGIPVNIFKLSCMRNG